MKEDWEAYFDCHYYEPKQGNFESCPVTVNVDESWDCITEHCINCPYNPFAKLKNTDKLSMTNGCLKVNGKPFVVDFPEAVKNMDNEEIPAEGSDIPSNLPEYAENVPYWRKAWMK
jgi:hypothetical protein